MTADTPLDAPHFDTKVVVLLGERLEPWQELNVTAFLSSGIATSEPDLVGEPYMDADGVRYLPMLRQPVLVMTGDDVALAIYTRALFHTPHDAANRAAVAAVASDDLDLAGIALRGPRNVVDRMVKGARFHA